MWELIDEAVDDIFRGPDGDNSRGYALGLATMYATFINPYQPDVDAVRAEAMERWEARRG